MCRRCSWPMLCPPGMTVQLGQDSQSSQPLSDEEQHHLAHLHPKGLFCRRVDQQPWWGYEVWGCKKGRVEMGKYNQRPGSPNLSSLGKSMSNDSSMFPKWFLHARELLSPCIYLGTFSPWTESFTVCPVFWDHRLMPRERQPLDSVLTSIPSSFLCFCLMPMFTLEKCLPWD